MKKSIIFALCVVCFSSCEKDEDHKTLKELTPGDNAIVTSTSIKLSCKDGNNEEEYFIGDSQSYDNMSKIDPEKVSLQPYKQYFWYVSKDNGDTKSEIQTFYCVPNQLQIETDNGDGEWAAIFKWPEAQFVDDIKIDITPNVEGYAYEKEVTIPKTQSFLSIKRGDINNPKNEAYTTYWDDENGVYYNPIVYTISLSGKVQVGDKEFDVSGSAKEIILDKQKCVRDHEFNVYSLVRIGDQIWTRQDFRAKSYIKNGDIIPFNTDYYTTDTLKSGLIGYLYSPNIIQELNMAIPDGFHISSAEDWKKLIQYYDSKIDITLGRTAHGDGFLHYTEKFFIEHREDFIFSYNPENEANREIIKSIIKYDYFDNHFFGSTIRHQLSSAYDWLYYEENKKDDETMFNSKPFNTFHTNAGVSYLTLDISPDYLLGPLRYSTNFVLLWSALDGVSRIVQSMTGWLISNNHDNQELNDFVFKHDRGCIRLVKD